MEPFGGHTVGVRVRVSLDLDTERDALLSSMFLGREFGADTVHLNVDAHFFGGIPGEFDDIQICIVLDHVVDAVREGHVDLHDPVTGTRRSPGCDLLPLHVLKASFVKAQSHDTLQCNHLRVKLDGNRGDKVMQLRNGTDP